MSLKGVILIGGPQKGTRFRPLSLECPKPLFPIAGYPTIQHHIDALAKVPGVSEILLLGFYQHHELETHLEQMRREYAHVHLRYLQEFTSLGTAGGIYHFKNQLLLETSAGNPSHIFIVNADVCGDIPYIDMLSSVKQQNNCMCTILTTEATRQQSLNYGCVVTDAEHRVLHYVDKPSTFISTQISCGIYLITPALFNRLEEAFHKRAEDELAHRYESELREAPETLWFERDILPKLTGSNQLRVYHTQRWWSQIKTAAAAIYANRHMLSLYALTHPDRLYKATGDNAPTIEGDIYIHPTATVDASAVIGPNVSIGRNVTVGAGARIRESIILDDANIGEHACVLHAIIGWRCVVGHWSRVEGTPSGPNPNMPFAKMESKPLFSAEGRLNPAITILGCGVQVPRETILLNSIVLPHKELSSSCKNQIIL